MCSCVHIYPLYRRARGRLYVHLPTLYVSVRTSCVILGWQADARDPDTGAPIAHTGKFPNGIKDLADKVHDMGLKVRTFLYVAAKGPTEHSSAWNIQQRWNVSVESHVVPSAYRMLKAIESQVHLRWEVWLT